MIKVIVHLARAIVTAIIALLFASCGFGGNQVDGSGNVTTQTRKITGKFTAINAESGLEVYVIQGAKTEVIVEADDNLQQHIKTELHGNKLEISCDVNTGNATRKVTVTLPVVTDIEAAAGSLVKTKTVIKSDDLVLSASSGGNLEAAVDAKRLSCESSSGSQLKVSGKTESLKSDSSSGSNLNAKDLVATTVKADASSGGTIIVNPIDNLSANASSGGSVNYVKTPNSIDKKTDSGGSVSQN